MESDDKHPMQKENQRRQSYILSTKKFFSREMLSSYCCSSYEQDYVISVQVAIGLSYRSCFIYYKYYISMNWLNMTFVF